MDSFKLKICNKIGVPGSCVLRLSYKMQVPVKKLQNALDEMQQEGYVSYVNTVKMYRLTDKSRSVFKNMKMDEFQDQTKALA